MSPSDQIVIFDGTRTPAAVRGAIERWGLQAEQSDEVVMGRMGQVGAGAFNARRVTIVAGLPISTPAHTVNRLCGSGRQPIWLAAIQMHWTGADFAVSGGNESMSPIPFYDFGPRGSRRLGDRTLVDGTWEMLTNSVGGVHMGVTAENAAATYAVTRSEQDAVASESKRKVASGAAGRAYNEEIVPVRLDGRRR